MFKLCVILFTFAVSSLIANRSSSAPYISGDTFRQFCNFTFDELSQNLNPEAVKNGDALFVKTDLLGEFFKKVHPSIRAKYILITHNSDLPVPGGFAQYLDDPKIIAWFGQNLTDCQHPKMHPIPIGLANQCWGHGNIHIVKAMQNRIPSFRRTILLYMNFQTWTFPSERNQVANMFKDKPYCVIEPLKDFEAYLADLAKSVFVLSPRGNGIDCHRTWESLLMGAIPIVKASSLDPLYENLPVLIVNDWSEINEEFLQKKYQEMSAKTYQMERAYSEYWLKWMESYKIQQ